MPGSQEFEFKFEVIGPTNGVRNPLREAVEGVSPVQLRAVYFETKSGELRKAGLMLRIRSDGRRNIMTLKSDGSTPFDRGEWEFEVPDLTPDLSLFAATPHAEVLARIDASALKQRLDTDIHRRSAKVVFKRSEIEVTLDTGELRAGGKVMAVHEFEVELKHGRRDEIFRFVRDLPDLAELRLGLISKGERGFRLADGTWGQPVKGAPVVLVADMGAGQAFAAIAHACLHQFALNMPAFEIGEEIEGVHQSRVALRRLRAAISLFKPLFETDRTLPQLREELGWIGTLLGRARDLDVLLGETIEPALEREPESSGLAELCRSVQAQRTAAHAALKQQLVSPRLSKLLLDLTLWLEDGPWRRSRAAAVQIRRDGLVTDYVKDELGRRFTKFCAQAKKLERLSPTRLHEERIRAKKLRYGSQFFESLAGGKSEKSARKMVKLLGDVQTALGEIQDAETRAAVLSAQAQAWTASSPPESSLLLCAAGRLAAQQVDTDGLVKQAARAARKVCDMKPFWDSF